MKKIFQYCSAVILCILLFMPGPAMAQSRGLNGISTTNLRATDEFLSSVAMQGRKTGMLTNEIAAEYLASEALKLGLKPLGMNGSFFQEYTLSRIALRNDSSWFETIRANRNSVPLKGILVYHLPAKSINIEAPLVFAGYGINSPEDGYNDLGGIDAQNKILMIMDRAPSNRGKCLMTDSSWMKQLGVQKKILGLVALRPKAICIVMDPK